MGPEGQEVSMRSVSNEYIRVGRPEVSDNTLNGFVICGEDEVRRRIAESDKATPELLATLCEDESSSVRKAVAANVNAPVEVLINLVVDKDPDVRFSMAENHNLHPTLLQKLTCDDNPYISCRAKETLKRALKGS